MAENTERVAPQRRRHAFDQDQDPQSVGQMRPVRGGELYDDGNDHRQYCDLPRLRH